MKKALILALVILAGLALISCNSSSSGGGSSSGFISGTWSGTMKRSTGETYTLAFSLSQNGTTISGTATIATGTTSWTGDFTGTVSNATAGGTISISLIIDSGDTYAIVGTYTATAMTGNWQNLTSGTHGTWTVAKL